MSGVSGGIGASPYPGMGGGMGGGMAGMSPGIGTPIPGSMMGGGVNPMMMGGGFNPNGSMGGIGMGSIGGVMPGAMGMMPSPGLDALGAGAGEAVIQEIARRVRALSRAQRTQW